LNLLSKEKKIELSCCVFLSTIV